MSKYVKRQKRKKGEARNSASRDDPDPALLSALECPVCCDTLSPPVEQCRNGHCICGPCRKKVQICPVCKGAFSGVRSRIAEDIVDQVLGRQCENHNLGCPVRDKSMLRLAIHQLHCEYRPCQCMSCSQVLTSLDLLSHWHGTHKAKEVQGPTVKTRISTENVSLKLVYLVQAHDELFWCWGCAKDQVVFFGVTVCGKPEASFAFEFKLRGLVTPKKLVFSGRVHSSEDHKTLDDFEPCSDCVCATKKIVAEGVDVTLTISKAEM